MFTSTSDEDILSGKATDKYFFRTIDALEQTGSNPTVVADISADQFPDRYYEVLAGLNDAAKLLSNVSDSIEVWSLPEGTLFNGGPVMRIRGPYNEFAQYETSLLGFLSQASGVATKSLLLNMAAKENGNPEILSFGARHMNPKVAPVIERSALIGGVDGISHVSAGDLIGVEPVGTMPHSLVISLKDQEKAWEAYNESAPKNAKRIMLCDTWTDEADESLRAAKLLGDDLDGVRLDTTGSRRGSFEHIIKEVRWKLDLEGYEDVGIYISGGLEYKDVIRLGPLVEGIGVGSFISNAEPIDFSLDIVQIDGEPTTKRGKLPGLKKVYRKNQEHCVEPTDCIDDGIFEKIVENGELLVDFPVEKARERVEKDIEEEIGVVKIEIN